MTTTKNEDESVGYSITSDEGDNHETIMRTRATTKKQGDDEGEPNGKDDDDHRDDDGKHEDADDDGNRDTDVDENDTKHEYVYTVTPTYAHITPMLHHLAPAV